MQGCDDTPSDENRPAFDWEALVRVLVHPTKVALIDVLLRTGRAQSATDLTRELGDPDLDLAHISHHLRTLAKKEALIVVSTRKVLWGADEKLYFFPAKLLRKV